MLDSVTGSNMIHQYKISFFGRLCPGPQRPLEVLSTTFKNITYLGLKTLILYFEIKNLERVYLIENLFEVLKFEVKVFCCFFIKVL